MKTTTDGAVTKAKVSPEWITFLTIIADLNDKLDRIEAEEQDKAAH